MTASALTLHLGVQKTASTAFHHFLHLNAAALAGKLTVRTPAPGFPTEFSLLNQRAAIDYSLTPDAAHREKLAARIGELRDELVATGPVPILVSHENLPGAMPGNGGEVKLYPQIGAILGLLAEHLAPFAPRFVFYTREMHAWKGSVYNQAVKTDGYAGTRAAFEAETAACGTWDEMRARAEAAVGADSVTFFRLEDETDPMRPGQQLLAQAGLSAEEIAGLAPLSGRPNESLNPGALEFMRQINRAGLAPKPRTKVMRLVTQNQALFAPSLAGAETPGEPS